MTEEARVNVCDIIQDIYSLQYDDIVQTYNQNSTHRLTLQLR
jgi:hypothetical protein